MGAIGVVASSPTVRDVVIRESMFGEGYRAAVVVEGGAPQFIDCSIVDNLGYAFAVADGYALITGGTIAATNGYASYGTSVRALNATVEMRSTVVRRAAGLQVWNGSLHLDGCLLEGIATQWDGILARNSSLTIDRCTIVAGRALRAQGTTTITMSSSILWGNCSPEVVLEAGTTLLASCSDLDPAEITGAGTYVAGPGMIHEDPLFCIPWACGDPPGDALYSLPAVSPARDAPGCGTMGALYGVCTISVAPTSWGRVKAAYRGP